MKNYGIIHVYSGNLGVKYDQKIIIRTNITFYLLLGKDQKDYVDAYAE